MKSVPLNIQLFKDVPHQILWSSSAPLQPGLPQGVLKVSSSMGFNFLKGGCKYFCCSVIGKALGKCQFVVDKIIKSIKR